MSFTLVLSLAAAASMFAQPPAEAPSQPPEQVHEQSTPEQSPAHTSVPAAKLSGGVPAKEPAPELAGTPEAKAAFDGLLDTIRSAKTLVFHSRTTNTGSLAGYAADSTAVVRMRRIAERAGQWQLHVTGSGSRRNDPQATSIDVVRGPLGAVWLDHEHKTLNERPLPQSTGPLIQMALGCLPTQIVEPNPFTREAGSAQVTIESTEHVDGVECSVLAFRPKKGSSTSRIWVGVRDHLPRKFERSSELKTYASTTTIELSDVRLNEPLTDADFTIDLPQGYERASVWTSQPHARNSGGPSQPRPRVTTDASAPPNAGRSKPPPMPLAPDFDVRTAEGEHVTLASVRGRAAVLYFWGSWSLPGRSGLAALQKIHEELADKRLRTLAITVRERSKDAPAALARSTADGFTVLFDGDKAANDYGVVIFPTFVVLDRAGSKVGMVEGYKGDATAAEVRSLITAALAIEVTEVEEETEVPPEGT